MPAVDFGTLGSPEVTLVGSRKVRSGLTTDVYTGFSAVGQITVVAQVTGIRGNLSPGITVAVEGSDDGVSWVTVVSWAVSVSGMWEEVVVGPPDRLRVVFTPVGGLREASIGVVKAIPSTIDQPGGEGDGSPVGVVTPSRVGENYTDTTNGGFYVATGLANTDWVVFGVDENAVGGTAGVGFRPSDRSLGVLAGDPNVPLNGSAYFSDAYSLWNGNGDGLQWVGNGTDGQQTLIVRIAGNQATLLNKDGNMIVPGAITWEPLRGVYENGAQSVIADGDSEALAFALESGDALLDLADPRVPTFVYPGTYSVTVRVKTSDNMTAGGFAEVILNAGGNHPIVGTFERSSGVALSETVTVAQFAQFGVDVNNFDGSIAHDFQLEFVTLVKLA